MLARASLAASLIEDAEISALFGAQAEIAAILRFEAALARAEADIGTLSEAAAETIEDAIKSFAPDLAAIGQGMVRDGVPIPVLVKALRAAVGEPYGAFVHRGATSQDAVDTGLMLRMKVLLGLLCGRLDTILAALETLADTQGATPLMAQTRMQAALPFTAADKLATWARPLAAHRARLAALGDALPIQLGGPIGHGVSFGAPYEALRAELAARLGLRDAAPWHSDRTLILDIAQSFALLTGTLGKIGQDLALMAQNEVGAVSLPGGGASSAMAHKQNPVAAEVLVSLARLNAGYLGTLAQSLVHENERSGAAWTLEWLVLPEMAQASGAALSHASVLLAGLRFQPRTEP
ncbi:3-carboxy-cis,cis-muconate cycloisomerase [Aureimonas ureilytica]|uniref:3-carboxy-cis,cis-muconate cycloisomerase n=1 Tax=Aureimonas ureilytica TaxID=401562 RepID=A0A175RI26_9HYPH|nr:3-carboxy-cis,cis-muconate cycloisomerase [Aureimonas ureilytica]KTR03437.1 3-carboxy-cis,cis-muconate cycloisomerase [Aureimonas ureilytica]